MVERRAAGGIALTGALLASMLARAETTELPARDASLAGAVGMVVCSTAIGDRSITIRGTGTVVGSRRTVLTVAHNFFLGTRRLRRRIEFHFGTDCVFRQYDASGATAFETRFTQATFGGFEHNSGLPNEDWAVLRTAEPLPDTVQALSFAALDSEHLDARDALPVSVLAFHSGRRRGAGEVDVPRLTQGALFEVDYAGFSRLAHTAETDDRSSGAALVLETAGGDRVVVGIHRSSAEYGDFNLAVPLSDELIAALNSYAHNITPRFGLLWAGAAH